MILACSSGAAWVCPGEGRCSPFSRDPSSCCGWTQAGRFGELRQLKAPRTPGRIPVLSNLLPARSAGTNAAGRQDHHLGCATAAAHAAGKHAFTRVSAWMKWALEVTQHVQFLAACSHPSTLLPCSYTSCLHNCSASWIRILISDLKKNSRKLAPDRGYF